MLAWSLMSHGVQGRHNPSSLDGETARQVAETMQALEDAKPHLRHELGARTDLRYVPVLEFVPDRSAERASRIARLLREARGE